MGQERDHCKGSDHHLHEEGLSDCRKCSLQKQQAAGSRRQQAPTQCSPHRTASVGHFFKASTETLAAKVHTSTTVKTFTGRISTGFRSLYKKKGIKRMLCWLTQRSADVARPLLFILGLSHSNMVKL
jgi:hypothetical protein